VAEGGTSNIKGGFQGCTISLQAVVNPRRMPRALIEKKNKFHENPIVSVGDCMSQPDGLPWSHKLFILLNKEYLL
jgi:hypothetical protein